MDRHLLIKGLIMLTVYVIGHLPGNKAGHSDLLDV